MLIGLCYDAARLTRPYEHAAARGDAPALAQTPALVQLHLSWIKRQHQQKMLRFGGEKSDLLAVELTEGLAKHKHCHKRGDRAALCGSSQPL